MGRRGKHFSRRNDSRRSFVLLSRLASAKKPTLIAMAGAMVVTVAIAGTIAWLVASSSLTNRFQVGEVEPVVNEEITSPSDGEENWEYRKENVTVTNKGTASVPIYVRVSVSAYFRFEDGSVEWRPVFDSSDDTALAGDYYADWGNVQNIDGVDDAKNPSEGCWIKAADGYYYWSLPLDAGETTDFLIDSLEMAHSPGTYEDKHLTVDITAEGIQADPARAAEEAWGVDIDPSTGVLTPAASGSQGGE